MISTLLKPDKGVLTFLLDQVHRKSRLSEAKGSEFRFNIKSKRFNE